MNGTSVFEEGQAEINIPSGMVEPTNHDTADEDRRRRLRGLGIYTPATLVEAVKKDAKKPFLVDGLLRPRSVNLLVGDSGLGKTPLAIQMGVSIAAGRPLLGRAVQQGRVLYCDAESGKAEFCETLQSVSRFLGLPEPPADFHVWSPNWDATRRDGHYWVGPCGEVQEKTELVKPAFVIVDAFRTFWPDAETKNRIAAETIAALRKVKGVTWLLLHHRRKLSHERGVAGLVDNPQGWFQESAGALALVNQSDTRIGVEDHAGKEADLLVAGFLRGSGRFVPMDIARVLDEGGEPLGYRLLTGSALLNEEDRALFERLPSRYRFKDAEREMGGKSASNVARFNKRCEQLQIVQKVGAEYVKTGPSMESVEGVESSPTPAPRTPSAPSSLPETGAPVTH